MTIFTQRRRIWASVAAAAAAISMLAAPAESDEDTGGQTTRGLTAPLRSDAKASLPGDAPGVLSDAKALLLQGAPGVLVDVRTPGRTLKVRAGYGNLAERTPVPWNARFRIGSLTKPFVAATVLQLVGEGHLTLHTTVEELLPGVVDRNGNDGSRITVRQLLQHTSGLPEYLLEMPHLFSLEGFQKHRFDMVTPQQAVRLAMRHKPDFAPGTSWSYSNTGYMLAGMIIEAVTGRTWQEEVRRRIVRPLDLTQTLLPGTRAGIPGPNAIGYERFAGPGATVEDPNYSRAINATRQNPSWGGAAGEIISTTRDTQRFLRALINGRLLRPAELAEMQKTVPTNEGFRSNWPGARYGLGLVWIPNSCGGSWAHGGDIMGYMTRNGISADGRRSVMVTINTDTLQRQPGVPAPVGDVTTELIDNALCPA
jgi:D-alanyl-D-alanine carboxypeptidase